MISDSSLIIKTVSFDDDEIIDEYADQSEKISNKILSHSKHELNDVSSEKKSNNNNEFEYLKSIKWKYLYEEHESNIENKFLEIEKNYKKILYIY